MTNSWFISHMFKYAMWHVSDPYMLINCKMLVMTSTTRLLTTIDEKSLKTTERRKQQKIQMYPRERKRSPKNCIFWERLNSVLNIWLKDNTSDMPQEILQVAPVTTLQSFHRNFLPNQFLLTKAFIKPKIVFYKQKF